MQLRRRSPAAFHASKELSFTFCPSKETISDGHQKNKVAYLLPGEGALAMDIGGGEVEGGGGGIGDEEGVIPKEGELNDAA